MASIAFVFAGQGAQYPGMGRELYESSSAARSVFDRAEALRPGTIDMCFNGSDESLRQTVNTQPCLFTMDMACAQAALEAGVAPSCCAGFSLGEVAAACFAGVMDFDEAFRFVIRRSETMQACADNVQGAMGAVMRLTPAQVEEICAGFPGDAYPVNYNCPGQTVVACRAEIFDALSAAVTANKGRMLRLNVSGAFHTPWMADASRALGEYLSGKKLSVPRMPFYANVDAQPYGDNAGTLLSRQVSSPVRWQQTIENMKADVYVELGAGRTLTGLIRKINAAAKTVNVEKPEDIARLMEAVNEG